MFGQQPGAVQLSDELRADVAGASGAALPSPGIASTHPHAPSIAICALQRALSLPARLFHPLDSY